MSGVVVRCKAESSAPGAPPSSCAGHAPVAIGSLKADFTNIPAGTKLTVGSILFKMLELPPESAQTDAAPKGTGAQLQTPASVRPTREGESRQGQGDSFSNIDIRVGKITKVRSSGISCLQAVSGDG